MFASQIVDNYGEITAVRTKWKREDHRGLLNTHAIQDWTMLNDQMRETWSLEAVSIGDDFDEVTSD